MGTTTGISWTDHSFNPWWGCAHVSPGCVNCYAETLAKRTGHDVWGAKGERRLFGPAHWLEPLRWNAHAETTKVRERVFAASMADVFEDHPAVVEAREWLWDLISRTPALDWQILTKRPENIPAMLPALWGDGWPNVWLGVSAEDQERWDQRLIPLLEIPAVVHFVSAEPLIGPIFVGHEPGPDWLIIGGESGPNHRPMDPRWAEHLARRCSAIPVFVKQDSGQRPGNQGRLSDALWARKEFPRP